ncbi:glutamine-hydrolyzing GMP synthase [Dethiosulfovibrio salsuginis]|uniref:GMP synthase [glutamine-hydrolyzing] n=1 Tax=Dethiosulfovibrio salsuginis TaxID=561720 RepID=A0A1X7JBM0_9BACT|nr:glutamine-hydrolyzing GMP synthase [Dethiosulfovibrio salsuginis]SMG24892.1 GMP synthase (glutamine-hydrolyzing) [Dethiosulfovibrio salsuginis]
MDNIVILDCGSQFTQLIARRIRELKVHSEILPWDVSADEIAKRSPKGLIISGGPRSVLEEGAPRIDESVIQMDLPVLGLCYGMQYLCKAMGGQVRSSTSREYGRAYITVIDDGSPIYRDVPAKNQVWMSHGDDVESLPEGTIMTSRTDDGVIAGFRSEDGRVNGFQYHPEVAHTEYGETMLSNFLFHVCRCAGDWDLGDWVENAVEEIRETVGQDKVICGLSGGVDSSVAAALVSKAIGDRLQCIFVDTGMMRDKEAEEVMESYRAMDLNVIHVDASERFLKALEGVTEPEKKRKVIGELFVRVFEAESSKVSDAKWLLQGTLYPDVIESGHKGKGAAVIKSHHNVGGLPDDMSLKVLEPLRDLFKDEVRALGRIIDVPEDIVSRHPFPGPGLAVRCLGDITVEKLDILRKADRIYLDEIRKAGLYNDIWQAFAVLLPVYTVGVMGDDRTYARVLALRAITSSDGMTAEWFRFPNEVLDRISTRICNEVQGVNRVVYDVTSKPPATVEWE